MTWVELCNDKNLRDLPYKIELNRAGKIIMGSTRNLQGYFASKIAFILKDLLPRGETIAECAIETEDSTKVADVAWASKKTFAIIKDEFSCSVAPEICVEVLSPSHAREYGGCDEIGALRFFNSDREIEHSIVCPTFPKRLEA